MGGTWLDTSPSYTLYPIGPQAETGALANRVWPARTAPGNADLPIGIASQKLALFCTSNFTPQTSNSFPIGFVLPGPGARAIDPNPFSIKHLPLLALFANWVCFARSWPATPVILPVLARSCPVGQLALFCTIGIGLECWNSGMMRCPDRGQIGFVLYAGPPGTPISRSA